MTRIIGVLVAGCALLALFVATAAAGNSDGVTTIRVGMNGAQEAPAAGDPDGSGKAVLKFDAATNVVCYAFTYRNIDTPTAGHIHLASRHEGGPVVIPLFVPGDGRSPFEGCAAADPDVAAVLASPHDYYVNVHNAAFPGGAVRGQLHPGG